jgi:hypothetical protein
MAKCKQQTRPFLARTQEPRTHQQRATSYRDECLRVSQNQESTSALIDLFLLIITLPRSGSKSVLFVSDLRFITTDA